MKKSVVAVCLTLALTLLLAGCGSSNSSTTPTYVVAADAMSGSDIEVFAINPSTSALTAITDSPYNFSLSGPDGAIVTHPNGKWVYVCDWSSDKVAALSVDNSTGTPTEINSLTDSGACDWSGSMAITPAGKYVYTADFNLNMTAFSVDSSTGTLTKIGSTAIATSGQINMVAATDTYVYAADTHNNIYIMQIGSDGSLGTPTTLAASTTYIYALQVDRSQKFLYASTYNAGVYGLLGYSIASDGSLTSLGSAVTPTGMGSVSQMVFSGDNKFMYAADSNTGVRGFSFNANSGAITEVSGSPFNNSTKVADSVAMDPSGKFVYADDNCANIYSWKRDSSTGALSGGTSTTSAGHNVCQLTVTWK